MRADYRDVVDIEIVAFSQGGMLIRPGTAQLMEGTPRLRAAGVTVCRATALGRANYGLTPVCDADLILVEAGTVAEAVAAPPCVAW